MGSSSQNIDIPQKGNAPPESRQYKMDPFTCLNLAASTIAVLDFGSKLLGKGHLIYKKGQKKGGNSNLNKLDVDSLKRLVQALKDGIQSTSSPELVLPADQSVSFFLCDLGQPNNTCDDLGLIYII